VAASVTKKRPAALFFTALAFILLYFILFPYPLGKELVARPAWAVQATGADTPSAPASGPAASVAPFQSGDRFGYVRADGRITYSDAVLYRVALSDRGFVNYTRLGTDWIMRGPDGKRLLNFSGDGYPFLSPEGDRLFIVKSDLSGLIELDANGDALWSRDFPSMITSVSLGSSALLVGLLNGSLVLLNGEGYPVREQVPEPGRIPVVLGCAVSADGALAACISGIDPQSLTVLRRQGDAHAVIARRVLTSDFRREARMRFAPDARFLVYETERGAGLFDTGSRRTESAVMRGTLRGIGFAAGGRCAVLASGNGVSAEIGILSPFAQPVCRQTFTAHEIALGGIDGQLLISCDGWLLRVDIEAL
jgi:hypothetical protein